jgi:hypothetical protein
MPDAPTQVLFTDPVKIVTPTEDATRTFLVSAITAARFQPKPNAKSDAAVPEDVEKLLLDMRETSQFAAVRRLHAEIRAKGKSDALVGGLGRGYAMLAILPDYQWSQIPKVFQARALL